MSSGKYNALFDEFSIILDTSPSLMPLLTKYGINKDRVKAGIIRLQHTAFLKTSLDDNLIVLLLQSLIDNYKRLDAEKKSVSELAPGAIMVLKWIQDIGDNALRVNEWQEKILVRELEQYALGSNPIDKEVYVFDDFAQWEYKTSSEKKLHQELYGNSVPFKPSSLPPEKPKPGSIKPDPESDEGSEVGYILGGLVLTKDGYLRSRFFNEMVNPPATLREIKDVSLEKSSGLFLAVNPNSFLPASSYADAVFEMIDGKLVRFELKAWYKMRFKINDGVLEITKTTSGSIVQGYRYLLEAIFLEGDITKIRYVIPKKTRSGGIDAQNVKDMLMHVMKNPDKEFVFKLLGGTDSPRIRFDESLTGRPALIKEAFDAASAEGDPGLLNIMKKWDEFVNKAPDKYPGISTFGSAEKSVDKVFDEWIEKLDEHLKIPVDGEKTNFNSGIILVDAEFPQE